jgi:hypothetical protein
METIKPCRIFVRRARSNPTRGKRGYGYDGRGHMVERARLFGHVRLGAAQHAACAPSRNQSFTPKMAAPQRGQSRRGRRHELHQNSWQGIAGSGRGSPACVVHVGAHFSSVGVTVAACTRRSIAHSAGCGNSAPRKRAPRHRRGSEVGSGKSATTQKNGRAVPASDSKLLGEESLRSCCKGRLCRKKDRRLLIFHGNNPCASCRNNPCTSCPSHTGTGHWGLD